MVELVMYIITHSPLTHLVPLPAGHSCSLCSQRGPLPPTGSGAAQDRGGAGLQRDGRQRAELAHLHLSHHPRGRGGEARRAETRRPASVGQWRGMCTC